MNTKINRGTRTNRIAKHCFFLATLLFSQTLFAGHKMSTKAVRLKENNLSVKETATPPVTLKGSVTYPDGKPIAGVSILVKGAKTAVFTDENGNFTIEVNEKDKVLIVSGTGLKQIEVLINGRTFIHINMSIASTELSEVVITGMQRREKNKMIGSVGIVTSKDLENAGITTLDKSLAGKVAGVYVRSPSGRPGETGTIIIRGINTMTGNKEPLYVLDGMPLQSGEVSGGVNTLLTSGIGNIPPEDIESITILKDATAASIYGARAANGVIVITTKVGQVGKDYVSYSGNVGVSFRPENKFKFMNSVEKVNFERGIYNDFHPVYGGRVNQLLYQADNGVISHEDAESKIAELTKTNTNWINVLYKPALTQSHNITLSGGTYKTQYNISLNYQNSEGTLITNKYQTGGLNMKISRHISNDLILNVNLYSTLKKNVEGASALDPFRYAVFANPYEKPYNSDGSYAPDMSYRNLNNDITYYSDLNYKNFNIVRELRENTRTNFYGNLRGQFGIEYSFLKKLRYNGTAVIDYTSVHDIDESKAGTFRSWANNWLNLASTQQSMILPQYNQGFLKEDMGRVVSYTVRNSIEYNNTFGGKHFTQLFMANEFSGSTNYQFNHFDPIYLQEYRIAAYPSWSLINQGRYMNLSLNQFGGSFFNENRSVSFIGSGVYSYDNRYVFNMNLRSDGVDIIGSKNQFSPLWSAGVRWNVQNEKFFKQYSNVVNRFVLSVGYGYRGSINRSVYPFPVYTLSALMYDDVAKASQFIYGNPVLKWEKKKDVNLGMEMSLFKGRVNLETRYFDEHVTDLLDNVQLPVSVGRSNAVVNVGALSNKGWELSGRFEMLKSAKLLWEVGANFTTLKNNLDDVYYNQLPNIASPSTSNIEGYPVNGWFGYKVAQVNQENGHQMVKALKLSSKVVDNKVVNEYTEQIIDLNTISIADLQTNYRTYYLGHQDPNWYGGFNTRIVYKAFELASNFSFAGGNKIPSFQDRREGPGGLVDDVTSSRTNRTIVQLNRWRQPGDITNVPAYNRIVTTYTNYLLNTDLEDGAFLKCTELAISWRAKPSMLGKSLIKTLKASVIANHLFTLSTYSGSDPETQTTFGYPTTKSIIFSLNIGF